MKDEKTTRTKMSVIVFMMLMILFAGCSGSGGNGTGDYRPQTEYGTGSSGEEAGGNVTYPEGYVPPVVLIGSPLSGKVIDPEQENLAVSGIVKTGGQKVASLLVNGEDVKINGDGTFSTEIKLPGDLSSFVAVEASAIDANGYAGRDRIVVLRGASVPSGIKSVNAAGVIMGQSALALPSEFNKVISDLLSTAAGEKNFTTDYIRVEVTEPFKAIVDLKLTGINVKTDYDFAINKLYAREPSDADTARLFADADLKGIEISADMKFISIGDINLASGVADTKVTLELNTVAADLSLKMGVKDVTGLGINVSSLDIELKDLEADIPSMIILTRFLDALGISHSTYYMKVPVKGWLAEVVSNVLNAAVNKQGLSLIVYIPPVSVDVDSILPGKDKNELVDSIGGIRDLLIGAELEKFTGTSDSIGFMVALSGKSKDFKDNGVISLPPTVTLSDALDSVKTNNMAFAVSADSINNILAALNEAGFGASLSVGELLPDIGLPVDMKADVSFGGPPFLDFSEGKIKLYVPNLKTGLYVNSSRQLEIAIDLVTEVETKISIVEGYPYLNLKLDLNNFNIYYMADRLGLEDAVDVQAAVNKLVPKIVELINSWLEKNPLVIDEDIARKLLGKIDPKTIGNIDDISGDLPDFEISLMTLESRGGYLSAGIRMNN